MDIALFEQTCVQPCWNGLEIGRLNPVETLHIINALSHMDYAATDYHIAGVKTFQRSLENNVQLTAYIENGVLIKLSLAGDMDLTLGEIQNHLQSTPFVRGIFDDAEHPSYRKGIVQYGYPDQGLAFTANVTYRRQGNDWLVCPTSEDYIHRVDITYTGTLTDLIRYLRLDFDAESISWYRGDFQPLQDFECILASF
jgi:hypothetical protein